MGLESVAWEACWLEPQRDPELERLARRELGSVPSLFSYFEACPWIARSLVTIHPYRVRLVFVDFALADLIGLVVSQDNSCRFCYATQRMLLRAQGYPDARIRELESDLRAAELEPRARAALEFAKRVSRASPRPCELDRARLREAGWSDEAIRELAFLTVAHAYYNRVATIPAIPVERAERLARSPLLRLFVPLTRRALRRRQERGERERAAPAWRSAPYGELVLRLDGLPAAGALRRLLDEALVSDALPRRAKLLVFAVVARGLDCPHSEREAAQLLAAEGLGASALEHALAHLGAPELDPLEAAVLRFARETIRFQPVEIQRRARSLAGRIGDRQFLELVGTAALANAACRLWIALDAP
jgi:AhpD family alkylhydroperoxidase